MKYFATLTLVVMAIASFGQRSPKRGLGYGSHSQADLQILAPGVSWIYNWYHQPEATAMNAYDDYDFDYVPMSWNGNFDKGAMRTFLLSHPDVKYILGWNEPNFKDQANMTPSKAAELWPDIEALADEFNLEIVGPAVNYCGNCVEEGGTTYNDPVQYLDDFFAACEGCRVDHIAIHCYMANVGALQWYVGLFKKYKKPIWLTEFAAWEGTPTLQDQKNFMVGAVDYLENDADVFRYAWFTGRFQNVSPFIGLLKESQQGALTELGQIYVQMPLHDPNAFADIPAVIEAERYNKMDGILLELTQDVSGFANVGYIEANDWLEYNINVPQNDDYKLDARLATMNAGSISVMEGENLLATINFTNTTGYQKWATFNTTVPLVAGQHKLRFRANNAGFNVNWFEFKDTNVLSNEDESATEISVSPNPSSGNFTITATMRWNTLQVLDVLGKKHYDGTIHSSVDDLPAGAYIFKFFSRDGKTAVRKVIRY